MYDAPTWNGITPGTTTWREAEASINALLDTDSVNGEAEYKDGYWVYDYQHPETLGWERVELWATAERDWRLRRVVAIYLQGPVVTTSDTQQIPDVRTLQELARHFGSPARVTWSWERHWRTAIWNDRGFMALTYADVALDSKPIPVAQLLLFEPMGIKTLRRVSRGWPWPLPMFATHNLYPADGSDFPDVLPEDPFDWTLLLPAAGNNR